MTLRSSHILTIILLATLLLTVPFFAEAAEPTAFQNVLWTITVSVFGLFVWMASAIVDIGINTYVIGFGDKFLSSGVGVAVDTLWTTVRDIFNLTFIFGLVFLGLKMILNSDDSNTKRWLINLILAALLVNFSLFITKAVVDFSNIAATQIANGFPVVAGKVSLSQGYMNLLGIQSLLESNTLPGTDQTAYGFIFGTMILFVIMSFVFAAGGILLLIRYVVLCLYMILSPLMFLGWVFPQLQSVSSQYWKGFLSRAFFAPVFLLLVYFSLFVLTALYRTTNMDAPNASLKKSLSAAAPGQMPSFESAFIPFILSAIFLIASIVVANKMGADGASTALRMGKSASSWAQTKAKRAGLATTGFAARNTVGRGAEYTRRRLDRGLARMGQGGAVSRFAARKLDSTVGAGLRSAENVSLGGSATLAQARERDRQQQAKFNRGADEQNRANALAAARQNAQNADVTDPDGRIERQNAINATGAQVRRMSNQEVLDMDYAALSSPEIAQHLTEAHITALRDSGMYTQQQLQDLGNARNDASIDEAATAFGQVNSSANELNTAFDQLGQSIRNMSADRKAGLGVNRLSDERVAVHLTDRDIEQLEQSGRFSATDIQNIRTARNDAQTNIAAGNMGAYVAAGHTDPAAQARFTGDRQRALMNNPQQAGQLPVAVFTDPAMQQYLTPEAVEQRMRNGLADDNERRLIRDNIDAYIIASSGTPDQARIENQWRNWVNRSSYGAGLGLTFGYTP